jgi:hypothetical protein
LSNSLSMKILAELESKNVAAGAAQIVSSIRSIENATGNASAAMDKMEASMRAMVSLQKQQADAARATADMAKQQAALAAASREARREASEASRAQAAASREAAKALRDQARAEREVAREAKRRASEQMQAQNQLKSSALQAAAVAGGVGAAGMAFISSAVSASATYEEQTNELEVFFGRGAKAADMWSRNLGTSLGKGAASVRKVALDIQKNLAPILGTQKAQEYTRKLTRRAIDLGSLADTDPETVAKNLISGLQGLPTPMRKYGAAPLVGYLQQFENARAEAGGRKAQKWKDMSYEDRTKLRADYMIAKTQHAEGDAERTANSTANTILRAKKAIEDAILELGQAFKDSLRPAISAFADLAEWFNSLSPATKRFIADMIVFGTALATVAGFIGVAAAAWWAYEAASAAAGIAGSASLGNMIATLGRVALAFAPVLAVIAILIGMAGIIADLYGSELAAKFEGVGTAIFNMIKAMLVAVMTLASKVVGVILTPIRLLAEGLEHVLDTWSRAASALGNQDMADRLSNAASVAGGVSRTLDPASMGQAVNDALMDGSLMESATEALKGMFESSQRGWEKMLGGLYSNDTLLPLAKRGQDIDPAAAAASTAARAERERARKAYERDALPMYMPGGYQDWAAEQQRQRASLGTGSLRLDSGLLEGASDTGIAALKARQEADLKVAAEAEKAAAKAREAAAEAEVKAAEKAQRHAEKMDRIYSDIISNVLGRFEAFAAGDLKGAFSKAGATIGGLIEMAGVPFAGAIGSAFDAVIQALVGPLEKLGGKLFGGAEISDAMDSITKVLVMATVAMAVFVGQTLGGAAPLGLLGSAVLTLLGPLGYLVFILAGLTAVLGAWMVLLVLLSTQTQEFANFAAMLNEAFKRMVAPLGSFWESLYPLGGALMQIGEILGPVGAAFLGLLNAPAALDPLIAAAVFAARGLLVFSYLMYATAAAWQVVRTTAESFANLPEKLAALGSVFSTLGQDLLEITGLAPAFAATVQWFQQVFASVGEFLNATGQGIGLVFDRVGRWFEQVWLGMVQPFQWLGTVIGMAVQGLVNWFMALSWVQAVMEFFAGIWTGITGLLMSGMTAFGKAMIGMINWVEEFTGLDIIGEGALGDLVESIDKAWKDLDKVGKESGKAEAEKFLAEGNATASATEQNINLPEAFKLAAARAAVTDANGNGSGSWGSGAPSAGDTPIDRFTPVVNITVMVNGITQESAMEYADKSRDFRQLIESGIVMARNQPNLDPGRGRRNRN